MLVLLLRGFRTQRYSSDISARITISLARDRYRTLGSPLGWPAVPLSFPSEILALLSAGSVPSTDLAVPLDRKVIVLAETDFVSFDSEK